MADSAEETNKNEDATPFKLDRARRKGMLARGTDLSVIKAIPPDRIFLVQMADAPRLEMDYLSWSRHYRCFPGQGDLPIADFWRIQQLVSNNGALAYLI